MDKPTKVLCSKYSSENREAISGTAPDWDTLILVSLSTPWQPNIEDSNNFPDGISEIVKSASSSSNKIRMQCIIPDEDYIWSGLTKVIQYSKQLTSDYFSKFQKLEFDISFDNLSEFIRKLIIDKDSDLIGQGMTNHPDCRDIFVCTHGSQDVCCASFGFPIYSKLKNKFQKYEFENTRVWRTSHIGGHRYAPNVIDMPNGRVWSRFGVDDIDGIFDMQYSVDEIKRFYRGLIGLDTPYEQVLERKLLLESGWDWTNTMFKSELVESKDNQAIVQIETLGSDTSAKSLYQATIEINGYVQRIECRSGIETKKEPQYEITTFEKLV